MRRTSSSVKPSISLNSARRLRLAPMLKPLVTSSMVTGETPVTNSRSTLPFSVPALSVAKKLR